VAGQPHLAPYYFFVTGFLSTTFLLGTFSLVSSLNFCATDFLIPSTLLFLSWQDPNPSTILFYFLPFSYTYIIPCTSLKFLCQGFLTPSTPLFLLFFSSPIFLCTSLKKTWEGQNYPSTPPNLYPIYTPSFYPFSLSLLFSIPPSNFCGRDFLHLYIPYFLYFPTFPLVTYKTCEGR